MPASLNSLFRTKHNQVLNTDLLHESQTLRPLSHILIWLSVSLNLVLNEPYLALYRTGSMKNLYRIIFGQRTLWFYINMKPPWLCMVPV